ncbi:hypothetical protein OAP63_02315 [Vibrio sp.]|uniref:hypothetical protein n=1 Tax=Vibrio viridaestus TaxID=2487322 RepID=UPI00140984D2|nr:hypothetical protein [Vibrio viridaestus]MDC0609544.1 hypothetical protein [Vibrio sp.]
MLKVMIILSFSIVLSACQLTRVEGKVGGTDVNVSDGGHSSNGTFCPPGQAKKNNC